MDYKDMGSAYYGLADWDMDYPPWHPRDLYTCKPCNIKNDNGEWVIPQKYERATDKQIKTVKFINAVLRTDFEPLLKTRCWRFIKDNFDEAKQIHSNNYSEWCEENLNWLPEY